MLLTGQITNWDDPALKLNGANAGVNLPNLAVKPVTESDPAGTNYVLEEYCIAEQPAVWAQYAKNMAGHTASERRRHIGHRPRLQLGGPGNGYDEQTTPGGGVHGGQHGGVHRARPGELRHRLRASPGRTRRKSVADVQNASGKFTTPSPVDVASALAYATQQSDGTHVLDFNGLGPNVYNPSTYSYLLTPTTGWSKAKGAVMSALRQLRADPGPERRRRSMNFASLGLSLERYGIDHVIDNVPGAVSPTSAEDQGYSCGDLTPTEVQAGQTTPTCGVTNGAAPPAPPGAPATTLTNGNTGHQGTARPRRAPEGRRVVPADCGSTDGSGGSAGAGADPSVALTGAAPPWPSPGRTRCPRSCIGAVLLVVRVGGVAGACSLARGGSGGSNEPAAGAAGRAARRRCGAAGRLAGAASLGLVGVPPAAAQTDPDRPGGRRRVVPLARHQPPPQHRHRPGATQSRVLRLGPRQRHR